MLVLADLVALDVALADALEVTLVAAKVEFWVALDFKATLGGDLVIGFLMLRILVALADLLDSKVTFLVELTWRALTTSLMALVPFLVLFMADALVTLTATALEAFKVAFLVVFKVAFLVALAETFLVALTF